MRVHRVIEAECNTSFSFQKPQGKRIDLIADDVSLDFGRLNGPKPYFMRASLQDIIGFATQHMGALGSAADTQRFLAAIQHKSPQYTTKGRLKRLPDNEAGNINMDMIYVPYVTSRQAPEHELARATYDDIWTLIKLGDGALQAAN